MEGEAAWFGFGDSSGHCADWPLNKESLLSVTSQFWLWTPAKRSRCRFFKRLFVFVGFLVYDNFLGSGCAS